MRTALHKRGNRSNLIIPIMKTRLFISIFILLFGRTSFLCGESYHQSHLIDREWVQLVPGKTYYATAFFTDKEWISKLFVDDVEVDEDVRNFYYLSDEIVDEFQSNSVGKSETGKYIVVFSKGKKDEGRLELYEILELTDTTLNIKSVRNRWVLKYIIR